MDKQRLVAVIGLVSLIALTGAGCPKKAGSGSTKGETSNGNDTYNASINLEIPEDGGKEYSDTTQELVQGVFGKVKITSFLQNFPAKGGLTVEYTANRNVTAGDINTLAKAVKSAGYTIEFSGVEDGTGAIVAHNSKDTLMFTIKIGESKIGALVGPKDEFNTEDEDQSSS